MSDNRTTELLPCPFCGRVAKTGKGLFWYVHCTECPAELGTNCDYDGNPEGEYSTEEQAVSAWNTRAAHGTLTAEQVREAIMSVDRWEKPMGNTGLTNTHLIIRDDAWQAIADELNAELGSDDGYESKMDALLSRLTGGKWSKSRTYDLDFMVSCVDEEYEELYEKERAELESGTCELVYGENDYGDDGWWCQSCGEWFAASFRHTGRNNIIKPSYCQHCGKSVKR